MSSGRLLDYSFVISKIQIRVFIHILFIVISSLFFFSVYRIQKSGLKLGQRDFREPESSATILHVALLYNHADIVNFLIGLGDRDLLLARYETAEYRNQTCLHVAVANGNDAVVESLILALDPEVGRSLRAGLVCTWLKLTNRLTMQSSANHRP